MEDEEETQNCEQLKNMVANHLEEKHALLHVDGDLSEEDADQTEEVGRRHKEAKYGA